MKKIYNNCFYGIYGIKFKSFGLNGSDPVIIWRGYYFNYYDIETALYNEFCENEIDNIKNLNENEIDTLFSRWIFDNSKNVKYYLMDCINGGYNFKSYDKLVANY